MRPTLILALMKIVNGSGDRSDDDYENSTNQRNNDEEQLDPYRLENLLLDDSDDDITEYHDGADGDLSQMIKTNQEARKSVWVTKEKAYMSGRFWCDAML